MTAFNFVVGMALTCMAAAPAFAGEPNTDAAKKANDRTLSKAKAKATIDEMGPWQACEAMGKAARSNLKTVSIEATETFLYAAEKYGVRVNEWAAIAQGRVLIGMSNCGAYASWGNPERANRTTNRNGTLDRWSYGNGKYLYLVNGIVESVQQ